MFDLSASAFVVDVPGPAPVLIFAPALLGLVALRWRMAHRVGNVIELPPARSFSAKCSARRSSASPGTTSRRRSMAVESTFELHASGGMPNWRHWLRRSFRSYNELANAVLGFLDLPMSEINVSSIPAAPNSPAPRHNPAGRRQREGVAGNIWSGPERTHPAPAVSAAQYRWGHGPATDRGCGSGRPSE